MEAYLSFLPSPLWPESWPERGTEPGRLAHSHVGFETKTPFLFTSCWHGDSESELCGELNATTQTGCSGKSAKPGASGTEPGVVKGWPGRGQEEPELLPVLSSTEGFPLGTSPGAPGWSRRTGSTAPLIGSSKPRAPLLPRTPGGSASGDGTCRLSVQLCVHVPRCVPCCAWSVPRPYTCVYVCVCRCALTCLSFLCMCRPRCGCHTVSTCWCLCS